MTKPSASRHRGQHAGAAGAERLDLAFPHQLHADEVGAVERRGELAPQPSPDAPVPSLLPLAEHGAAARGGRRRRSRPSPPRDCRAAAPPARFPSRPKPSGDAGRMFTPWTSSSPKLREQAGQVVLLARRGGAGGQQDVAVECSSAARSASRSSRTVPSRCGTPPVCRDQPLQHVAAGVDHAAALAGLRRVGLDQFVAGGEDADHGPPRDLQLDDADRGEHAEVLGPQDPAPLPAPCRPSRCPHRPGPRCAPAPPGRGPAPSRRDRWLCSAISTASAPPGRRRRS